MRPPSRERQHRRQGCLVAGAFMAATLALITSGVGPPAPAGAIVAPETPGGSVSASQRAWLETHGPLRIGFVRDALPSAFLDEGGNWRGFAAEIVQLGFLKLGVDIELVPAGGPGEVVAWLRNGAVDAAGAFAAREDLVAVAVPTEPFASIPLVFVTGGEHPDFQRVADIRGRIGTLAGSPMEGRLRRDFPALTVVTDSDVRTGIEALAAGRLDAYFGPLAAIGYLLQEARLTTALRPVGEPVAVEPLAFWSDPDQPVAGDLLDAALAGLSGSETAVLFTKWTGFDLSPTSDGPSVPRSLRLGLAGATLLAVLGGAATFGLRNQVRRRTADLRLLNAELETRVDERTAELSAVNDRLSGANELLNEANRKLADANADLETFVRSAGHDLRAPARHARFFADLLVADAPKLDEDARAHVEQIQQSADRMDRMLDSLVALARTTRSRPEPEEVDVTAEVAAFTSTLSASEPDRPVRWSIQPGMVVWADPGLLAIVVQNLIGNAWKFTAGKSTAGKDPAEIAVSSRDESDGAVSIDVSDNGPGFDPDQVERIWQPFGRLHSERDGGGSGLGLAIVQRILERHGGSVSVATGPEGTVFTTTWPAPPPPGRSS